MVCCRVPKGENTGPDASCLGPYLDLTWQPARDRWGPGPSLKIKSLDTLERPGNSQKQLEVLAGAIPWVQVPLSAPGLRPLYVPDAAALIISEHLFGPYPGRLMAVYALVLLTSVARPECQKDEITPRPTAGPGLYGSRTPDRQAGIARLKAYSWFCLAVMNGLRRMPARQLVSSALLSSLSRNCSSTLSRHSKPSNPVGM